MVKKLWRYVKPFSSNTGTLRTDGQTDSGRTDEENCYINIARQCVSVLTRDRKRIIPAIITGRISSFFLLLYYTPNSLCWLDGGPPYKNVVSKVGGSSRKLGGPDLPDPQWLRPCLPVWFGVVEWPQIETKQKNLDKICLDDSCLDDLLPPKRDLGLSLLDRPRNRSIYRPPFYRTKRYQSFINYKCKKTVVL